MVIFTTDDMCPEHIDFWKKYLDPVHAKYPSFKVIAFTTPFWHEKKENDVLRSPIFKKWFEERKDWVTIGVHGYHHKDFECLKSFNVQFRFMELGANKLDGLMPKTGRMFKPPFYKYNEASLFAAQNAGFRFYFTQDGILDLKTHQFYDRIKLVLLDSHVNPNTEMLDKIDKLSFDNFMDKRFVNNFIDGGSGKDERTIQV